MINLIPPDARREISLEYWIRVVSVWMVLIGLALLMIALLKVPTLVLVRTQLNVFSSAYTEAKELNDSLQKAKAEIAYANDVAYLLSGESNTSVFVSIIEDLNSLSGSNVVISNFIIEQDETGISNIHIVGNAATRISLARFSDDVEAHPLFLKADVPLSNLAKDKDINFSITIVPEVN